MVQGGEALSAIAQVGLGLAGFTGILVALGRTQAAFSRPEVLRLLLLLVSSLGAVISLAYLGSRIQQHRSEFGQLFSTAVFVIIATGSVLIVILQLANAVGLGAPPRSGSFLFGLLWLLFIGSLQFARILFVRGPGA